MSVGRKAMLLVGLALLVMAFLLINFRAAMSNTQAEHSMVTASGGEALPDAMRNREKVTVVVTGNGPLVGVLQEAVPAALRNAGLEVELVQELAPSYETPVLLVEAGEPRVFWTPLFATSQFHVEAGYASNGDTTFMSDESTEYESTDGPTINMSVQYDVDDTTWGILSYPGYYHILSDWLSKNIVEATMKLYERDAI